MAQVTRFYDRVSGGDGPVSGALQLIHVPIIFAASSGTQTYRVNFPAGMGFEITDAEFSGATVTAVIGITIGDTAAGAEVVASVTATTNLGALTIVDGTIDAGGFFEITVAATASGAVHGAIDVAGYVTSPPTSVAARPSA